MFLQFTIILLSLFLLDILGNVNIYYITILKSSLNLMMERQKCLVKSAHVLE